MTADSLARSLEEFLADSPSAAVYENGQLLFEMSRTKYSVTAESKCLLHLWSDERNVVRRVIDSERKATALNLRVQRFGRGEPQILEIVRDADIRPASARKKARAQFQQFLQRLLEREFPGYTIEKLASSMDLERSFSPVYSRGMLRRGRSLFTVLGANADELQPSIDAALTFGLLWLAHCRETYAARYAVEGLTIIVPRGRSAVIRSRVACLNHAAAKFSVCEFDDRDGSLQALDVSDSGNIETRLIRCPEEASVRQRFAHAVEQMRSQIPDCECCVVSPTEISFRLHGLEFARVRSTTAEGFKHRDEITFGTGRFETVLSDDTQPLFRELLDRLRQSRQSGNAARDALWRMVPERWLESMIKKDVTVVDAPLDPDYVYSQVPAFSATDRAMIDVLTCNRNGRLTVLELKADEDIHLPLQGLDYWARVNFHHQRGEFEQHGYFVGKQLSKEPPQLVLVAPSLRVHPATDMLLRYFSPQIDCTLIGLNENWREGVKVIFRKQRKAATAIA